MRRSTYDILCAMNKKSKKPILTPVNIAIATMVIMTLSAFATLAYLAGELRTNQKYLAQEVDKWDENVITLNKEIHSLQQGN